MQPGHAPFESQLELETITLSRNGPVMTLLLNRARQMNTVTEKMGVELRGIAGKIEDDRSIRVLVIRGAGAAFCAGGDIHSLFKPNLDDPARVVRKTLPDFHEFILALRRMDKVVLCAVHGVAAGGGLSLALACDYVVAAQDAMFSWAYRNLGTTTDGGGSFFLTRSVGEKRAFDLLLRRGTFNAAEAKSDGLISAVAAPAELDQTIERLAEEFARLSPQVVAGSKRLIYSATHSTLAEHLAEETRLFAACASGRNFVEGINAFLQKRKPCFE